MRQTEIRQKIDAFIRKYYKNQLLKGGLIVGALFLGLLLFISFAEYWGHFGTTVRALFFWGFCLAMLASAAVYIVRPFLGLYKLGKIISYNEAASIIGKHFEEVKDKLLNLLQLEEMALHENVSYNPLLLAGIEQKTKELRPFQFTNAIQFKNNAKYLRWFGGAATLVGIVLVFQSHIITKSTQRLVNYSREFKREAPFDFLLLNKNTVIGRGEDLTIKMTTRGKIAPEAVYLILSGQRIKMLPNAGSFEYEVKNISKNEKFYFEAAGFQSAEHLIQVNPVPSLSGIDAWVEYPAYTGKIAEKVSGSSSFQVPQGTHITWSLLTRDVSEILIKSNSKWQKNQMDPALRKFQWKQRYMQNGGFQAVLKNGKFIGSDTLHAEITVIPDQNPSVFAESTQDSVSERIFYFIGNASDDYGVARVNFKYRFIQSEQSSKITQNYVSVPLSTIREANGVAFYYVLQMDALGMAPSDEVEYFFEAWDNDAVNGSKAGRTQPRILRRESIEEVRKKADASAGNVKNQMQEIMKASKNLEMESKEELERLNRQRSINWQEKNRIQELLNQQKKVAEKIDELKKENEKLQKQQSELTPQDQKRQEQMNEIQKQLENEELKKLIEEIQKLLEKQAPKEELNEKMQQMQQMNQERSKEMDKLLEQFKQLQLEQKLEENIQRLDKLAAEQQKLSEQTEKSDKSGNDELNKKQEELSKELESLKEEIKEAEELNSDLEKPMDLDMAPEEMKKAGEEQKSASKNLDGNKNKKAAENQKNAAEQMKQAAGKMKESMDAEKSKRLSEDYQKIRMLLENLIDVSISQENVLTELSTIREYNPKFVELNRRQMVIKEETALIEDSLRALAKRQPLVSSFITKEIGRINTNMELAMAGLKARNLADAAVKEQFVMTGFNNLAVLLMESMQNMQQQMSQQQKQGNQSCNNPNKSGKSGKSKPQKSGKLSKSQEQMGQMLQDLQKKSQQQREGQQGSPKGSKESQKELNQEYGKMALMQEALRRELKQMRDALEKEGKEGKEMSRELKKVEEMMEQQERDLVNKRLTPEMLKRQKEIETRLLEHENSDRNQEQEQKRESEKPGDYKPALPLYLKEYILEKQKQREMLRKTPPELTPYFRDKSKEYLRTVQ